MIRWWTTAVVCLMWATIASAQGLAPRSYTYLDVPGTARLLGLGSVNVSASRQDVSMFWANPALLNADLHQHVSLGYQGYYQSGLYQMAYAHHRPWGTMAAGISAWNFGEFEGYDNTGQPTGTFTTGAYTASVAYARTEGAFTLAVATKLSGNQFVDGGGLAWLSDVAGLYQHPVQDLRVGIVFSNLGTVVGGPKVRVPWNIRLGTSYKPKHMPVRLSVTFTDLYQWDIVNFDSSFTEEIRHPRFRQQAFSHVVLGGELILGENFSAFVGYNPRRRQEMSLPNYGALAGFSTGLELKIKQFALGYGVGFYHLAGGTHQITLATDLDRWFTKKKTIETTLNGVE